jgi:hypothetical protein
MIICILEQTRRLPPLTGGSFFVTKGTLFRLSAQAGYERPALPGVYHILSGQIRRRIIREERNGI